MKTTNADVTHAFQDWLAMIGVQSHKEKGGFRLGYDGYGRVRIQQVVNDGGAIHAVAPGMSSHEFVDAVYFLRQSLAVKDDPARYLLG